MINIFNLNNSAKILKNVVNKINNNETAWVNGSEIKNFENQIKKNLKTKKEVCTCNSGSDALLLALQHLKKKNKDLRQRIENTKIFLNMVIHDLRNPTS